MAGLTRLQDTPYGEVRIPVHHGVEWRYVRNDQHFPRLFDVVSEHKLSNFLLGYWFMLSLTTLSNVRFEYTLRLTSTSLHVP